MKLYDLIHKYDWNVVWSTRVFLDEYFEKDHFKNLYMRTYQLLRQIEPVKSNDSIQIEKSYDEISKEYIWEVFCINESNDNERLGWLDFTPWSDWLGMKISENTKNNFAEPHIMVIILGSGQVNHLKYNIIDQ
ncbi:DUF6557 family protein [uncultured Desulfobacter sp.]|uniref:DUF6557 family protein n=1 Tax=uncultured Desulfobacter sp. TaxID=240139 RepID=UPI002AA8269F|nr:DUF6557 family protein [uncultured Desulfobacter sp.]